MIRWFWRIYLPLAAWMLVGMAVLPFGGPIEARLAPIRSGQRIEAVTRTDTRLCWTWISDKLRLATSDNMDVWLDRPATGDRSYPEVFNRDSGIPWHRNGILPVGHSERPYCILLPPDVRPGEPLVLRQTIHYRGLCGLWTVLVAVPDVVDPAP